MMLILDDHPLARQGLSSIIHLHQTDEEILEVSTIAEAISQMEAHNGVHTVFIDLNLGKTSGHSFASWVRENRPDTRVFIITSSSRESDFAQAREIGVDAYILKDAFVDEILYGIKVVERGGKFYSASLVEKLNGKSKEEQALDVLTDREKEVFLLLCQGYSNAEISQILFIADGTTKKHISSILSKLDLQNRVDAVLYARNNGYCTRMAIERNMQMDRRKKVSQ